MKFLSRNPTIFSFQSWNKSRFVSRKNSRKLNRNYHKNISKSDLAKLILKDFKGVRLLELEYACIYNKKEKINFFSFLY